MKFGKTFLSHQIPEWSVFYMNYKNLKKLIKNIDYDFNPNEMEISDLVNTILSQFFYQLDRNIEKVDNFYNSKFSEYSNRLNTIVTYLNYHDNKINQQIDLNELDEIISILLELKNFFRNLKWFGELNHKGFIKILKKLDKKMVSLSNLSNDVLSEAKLKNTDQLINLPNNNREIYLNTRVNALPFANEVELINNLELINNILNELSSNDFTEANKNTTSKSVTNLTESLASGQSILNSTPMSAISTNFDLLLINDFDDIIKNDDADALISEISKVAKAKKNLKFFINLLIRFTMNNGQKCIDSLFEIIILHLKENNLSTDNLLFDKFDINGRNFFHHLILHFGKFQTDSSSTSQKLKPGESNQISKLYLNNSGTDGDKLKPIDLSGFKYVLDKVDSSPKFHNLKFLLNAKDNYLRTPLHYASQYGVKDIAKLVLNYLSTWNLINKNLPIDDISFWGDQENLTPIHLSIIGKHPKTTEYLLVYSNTTNLTCSNLLLLAVRLDSPDILSHLIKIGGVDINYTDFEHNNETALYIAAKLNLINVVDFLLSHDANPEFGEMVFGWTPIFVAASEGFQEVVSLLVNSGCKFDLVDDSGWLPMEHASLRGHLSVANMLKPNNDKLLLYDINNNENNLQRVSASSVQSSNSNVGLLDDSLVMSTTSIDILPESNRNAVNEVYKQLKQFDSSSQYSLESGAMKNRSRSKSPINVKRIRPIKSFGHSYLNNDECVILLTLGTTDLRDDKKPIELNEISLSKTFITELDTALSLVVTCRNKLNNESIEPPVVVDLPLEDHHGSAADPISFKLTNNLTVDDVIVTFDIVPTYQYNKDTDINLPFKKEDNILGRAVAILNEVYTKVGPKLKSLNAGIALPIIESKTLNVLGSVRFEFDCVRPFTHPNMKIGKTDTYWKQLVSTRVIGHRGLGKNSNKKSLQLGENTVESFIAAASLGASYVEFDVQLTKDSVPVIYHDFLVAESGVDIPMQSLTAEQFLHLNDNTDNGYHNLKYPHPRASMTNSPSLLAESGSDVGSLSLNSTGSFNAPTPQQFALDDEILSKINRPRSMAGYKSTPNMAKNHHLINQGEFESDDELDRELQDQNSRRMKLTKTWKDKGFKGNARGLSIASNFVTLKELFKKLPRNVGFNIEVKYPMLDEAQLEDMGEIAYDINHYVDTILKVVYDENLTGRDIIFSSFSPDVCLMLSLKQPSIPILFLTEAGSSPMADIRASSLQNAIRFAKKWNLLGLVSAAEPLVMTPRLAQVVKSSGLVCVTYGVENNSPENCKIQMKAGVDAVIVDSVLAVREGIRKDVEKQNSESEVSSVN